MSNSKKPKRSLITIGESVKRLQAENQKLIEINNDLLEMLERAKNTLKDVYDCDVSEIDKLIKKATEL